MAHCKLGADASGFSGSCGAIGDSTPAFALAPATAVRDGAWRKEAQPSAIWAGKMTDQGDTAFAQLEIYTGGAGIMRTEYGWFPVSNFIASAASLAFDVDVKNEVPPNALDREIVERAAAKLSNAALWNRADTRDCPAGAKAWSIYCAMIAATAEVTGGSDHRRPAMEVVREVVDDRTKGRDYHHRLMDYNNDPTTTLADVASLFAEALKVMDDPVWLRKHGFATP